MLQKVQSRHGIDKAGKRREGVSKAILVVWRVIIRYVGESGRQSGSKTERHSRVCAFCLPCSLPRIYTRCDASLDNFGDLDGKTMTCRALLPSLSRTLVEQMSRSLRIAQSVSRWILPSCTHHEVGNIFPKLAEAFAVMSRGATGRRITLVQTTNGDAFEDEIVNVTPIQSSRVACFAWKPCPSPCSCRPNLHGTDGLITLFFLFFFSLQGSYCRANHLQVSVFPPLICSNMPKARSM